MTNTALIMNALNAHSQKLPEIETAHLAIAGRIPGWSGAIHRLFFLSVFDALPEVRTVLILGVYLGRDIATMLDVTNDRGLQVVGVDKFADTPCDDWPADKRTQGWLAAGYGQPPNAERALANINPRPPHMVRLIEADDAQWLPTIAGKFDFIYIDTAHDYATVARQIKQVRPLCHDATVIAGDDYTDLEQTWGVKRAVGEGFTAHKLLAKTIWFADAKDFT